MLKTCQSLLATGVIAMMLIGPINAAETIGWRDLTVSVDPEKDPFFGLSFETRKMFEQLLTIEKSSAKNLTHPISVAREKELISSLARAGFDAAELKAKDRAFQRLIALQRSSVRSEWDGADVRIPGYLLPLEFEGDAVSEFLLVPYVGACIHTPPPPANQIIHVKPNASFRSEGLFTPVWVTGRLSVKRSRQRVGLSDGQSGFDVGYFLEAKIVKKYTADPG